MLKFQELRLKNWRNFGNDYATINFAVDEAEAWLLADRISFAKYFNIPVKTVPTRNALSLEIADIMPYKTSLYILIELVPLSNNRAIKSVLAYDRPGKKPSTYNSVGGEYISKYWNIEDAIKNSESLERAVKRIKAMLIRAIKC